MKLSIIIVSYNVKYFLKQCLNSVLQSIEQIDAEIIVVDNNSHDGSVELIEQNFPSIKLIKNQENVGFGRANNQAIRIASGELVLLLNPDTLISEQSILNPIAYLDQHEDVGALGVKLMDGSGNFHKESKRGFPSIWSAFCKLTGIYKVFEKSKFFNYYYLGHLDENKIQSIDVLCGAYFLSRKSLLQKLDGFDEDFFMYGEDIDLSFRIKEEGYKVIYFPESSIIHFKGESSQKLNWRYIKSFYGSMNIYLNKHQKGLGRLMVPLLTFAVFGLAILTYLTRVLASFFWAVLDFVILFFCFNMVSDLWATNYHSDSSYYNHDFIFYFLLFNALIYVFFSYLFGKYDQKSNYINVIKGIFIGLLINLLIYGMMPESIRFSRFLILGFGVLTLIISGLTYALGNFKNLNNRRKKISNYLVVGKKESADQLRELIQTNNSKLKAVGFISDEQDEHALGQISEVKNILNQIQVDDIIFSTKDLDFERILKMMSDFGNQYNYKLASSDNVSILSSKYAKKQGEIITIDLSFDLLEPVNQRIKRLLDIISSVILIVLSPLLAIVSKAFRTNLSKLPLVFIGKYNLIAYQNLDGSLPQMKPGMFTIDEIFPQNAKSVKINYAKSYRPLLDLEYFLQALKK